MRPFPPPNLCVLAGGRRSHCVIQLGVDRRTLIESRPCGREIQSFSIYVDIAYVDVMRFIQRKCTEEIGFQSRQETRLLDLVSFP